MNGGIENEILKQIAEKLLMKKQEMLVLASGREDAVQIVNSALNSLLAKGMITAAPVGDGTFAVTQKGMREARKV